MTRTPAAVASPAAIVPVPSPAVTFTRSAPAQVPTVVDTHAPVPSPTPGPTFTPDPYAGLTVQALAGRVYGDGELRIEALLGVTDAFTRTLVSYPSDDLTIFGFMDVPRGEGPFPVVVVLHGYVDPARYHTLTYTTHYADALARAGYIAIHPNLRGYAPSGDGPNMFRTGMAVDVLNLLALARKQAGQPGPLERADGDALGLWGHSMGGGITLRTLTVSPDVDAAVLYGAMSGDERQNYEQIRIWSGGQRGLSELDVPEDALQRISPIYYLDRITAAVSIHHGDNDGTVPLAWSEDLCRRLQDLGKPVECYTYAGQPHTFTGEGDALFIRRTIEFFDARLKAQR